jgi:hypothetical protein
MSVEKTMSAFMNGPGPIASPLVLSDRLIALAIDADRSGFPVAARQLIATAHSVLDRPNIARPFSRSRLRVRHSRIEAREASLDTVGFQAQTATIPAP